MNEVRHNKLSSVFVTIIMLAIITVGIVFCSIGVINHNNALVTVPVTLYGNVNIIDKYIAEDQFIKDDRHINCGLGIRERTVVVLKVYCKYQNSSKIFIRDYQITYCSQIGNDSIIRLAEGSVKDREPCYFDSRDGEITTKSPVGYIIGLVFLSITVPMSIVVGITIYKTPIPRT